MQVVYQLAIGVHPYDNPRDNSHAFPRPLRIEVIIKLDDEREQGASHRLPAHTCGRQRNLRRRWLAPYHHGTIHEYSDVYSWDNDDGVHVNV